MNNNSSKSGVSELIPETHDYTIVKCAGCKHYYDPAFQFHACPHNPMPDDWNEIH